MRRENPTRYAMPMTGANERSLQTWRDVDRCEDAGGSGEDRRRGSASVGGVPAAQGYRNGLIQPVGRQLRTRRAGAALHISNCRASNRNWLQPSVETLGGGAPHLPLFSNWEKGAGGVVVNRVPYVRARHGVIVMLPEDLRPRCEARTRRGTSCQCQALPNGRCKYHGGMSTGARTPEGRARIAAAARRRWAEWRRRKAIATG